MSYPSIGAGITKAHQGVDGIVWNVLGQAYVPKKVAEHSFAWHATIPIESFIPPHIHDTQDEFILLEDAELDLVLDGQAMQASSGDLVVMPRGIPHGIFNNSGRLAKCLFWVTPTAKLFDLFTALHNVADTREVVRISALHDVRFLPPVHEARVPIADRSAGIGQFPDGLRTTRQRYWSLAQRIGDSICDQTARWNNATLTSTLGPERIIW